jgi:hypothetical protein
MGSNGYRCPLCRGQLDRVTGGFTPWQNVLLTLDLRAHKTVYLTPAKTLLGRRWSPSGDLPTSQSSAQAALHCSLPLQRAGPACWTWEEE